MPNMTLQPDDYEPPPLHTRKEIVGPAYRLAVNNPGRWVLIKDYVGSKTSHSRASALRASYKRNPCVEIARDGTKVLIRYTPVEGEHSGVPALPPFERPAVRYIGDAVPAPAAPEPEPQLVFPADLAEPADFSVEQDVLDEPEL